MQKLKSIAFVFLITFLLLELSLWAYTKIASPKIELPTYSLENTQSFWFDLNESFGTWHLPNHKYRQKKTCFDILYQSNEHGFRDKKRAFSSNAKRVLVIGDSFIEGVGVTTDVRLSDQLEKSTKIPHLNFGLAGNFGPTQAVKLYESYASKFKHDAVLVGILPANDFIDDDYELNKKIGSNRYKPYWKGEYPNYQLVYFQDSLHKSAVNKQDLKPFKKVLKNFTYSYNYLLYLKTQFKQRISNEDQVVSKIFVPSYLKYRPAQMNRLKYSLIQLKKEAAGKKLMVFTIPTAEEIIAFKSQQKNPLGKELTAFCANNNIEYLDLLPQSSLLSNNEIKELFLPCDGHWSAKGNRFAKEKIEAYFNFYKCAYYKK